MATYSISAVMIPARAYSSWVTSLPWAPLKIGRLAGELRGQVLALGEAVVLGLHFTRIGHQLAVAAGHDPRLARTLQALLDVDLGVGVGIGARRVVDGDRRLIGAGVDLDLTERHPDVGEQRAGLVDLARTGALTGRDRANGVFDGQLNVHFGRSSSVKETRTCRAKSVYGLGFN
jgi:hypothetical protein